MPLCRVACVNQAVAPSGFAIVMRWMAAAVSVLSSYHAFSAASAAIPGVFTVTAITNGAQTGPVTTSPTGTNGQLLIYKVLVTNPGNTQQGDIWSYDSLPPGLTMNTNVGGADGNGEGIITGIPTQPGVYKTGLKAWNVTTGPTLSATNLLTWTIYGGGSGATPPSITGPPVSQTVTAGATVTFTATATGTAPLAYSWKYNGAAITGAATSSLRLTNVQTTSSGSYMVTVTNSAGSQSASATLTVLLPPSIVTPPQSVTVSNGLNASFSVVASGSAPLNYQWQFNGGALSGATSSSLTITNVQPANQGDYTVVVSNAVGSITSTAAHLTVQTTSAGPFQLAIIPPVNGFLSFNITGPAQTNYVIWTSTNLAAPWSKLQTNFSATGSVHFTDSNAPVATRFYRATLSP